MLKRMVKIPDAASIAAIRVLSRRLFRPVAWRERFAGEVRLRGIAAEATPRRTRGRVRKADRGAVLALRKRKITPDVDRLAREQVLSEGDRYAGTYYNDDWLRQNEINIAPYCEMLESFLDTGKFPEHPSEIRTAAR